MPRNSRRRTIIEFSRAVHAEMDAIINVARSGIPGLMGATLYTTTYRCHNCAKHIVAAGIARVVYFEPYPKSLAIQLHSDALIDSSKPYADDKLPFETYGGVGPFRYDEFFSDRKDRKAGGQYIDYGVNRQVLMPIDAPFQDDLLHRISKAQDYKDVVFKK
jgi:deoxycytidylate deaminase